MAKGPNHDDKSIEILERYLLSGRRTIPVSLIRPVIERLRLCELRNSNSLEMVLKLCGEIIKLKTEIENLKLQIKEAGD